MIGLTSIIKLAYDLNRIQQVHWKLMRQNEPTAEKLAEVLDELAKMVSVLCKPSSSPWEKSFN